MLLLLLYALSSIHWSNIIGRRCDWDNCFLDHIMLNGCLENSGCADFEVIVELIVEQAR